MKAERLGLFAESLFVALGLFVRFDNEDTLVIGLAGSHQMIDCEGEHC